MNILQYINNLKTKWDVKHNSNNIFVNLLIKRIMIIIQISDNNHKARTVAITVFRVIRYKV